MDAAQLKAQYSRFCKQRLIIRRYTQSGNTRTPKDYPVKGNARLYKSEELIGTVTQGDIRAIVLADDLAKAGFAFPLSTNDKLLVVGVNRERAIIDPDERKALDGTLVAYEVQAR